MTKLLEQAIAQRLLRRPRSARLRLIAKIKNLPDNEQDIMATIVIEELEDEIKWEKAFADSQDVLAKLAAKAMTEYQAGKTQELDPETL